MVKPSRGCNNVEGLLSQAIQSITNNNNLERQKMEQITTVYCKECNAPIGLTYRYYCHKCFDKLFNGGVFYEMADNNININGIVDIISNRNH